RAQLEAMTAEACRHLNAVEPRHGAKDWLEVWRAVVNTRPAAHVVGRPLSREAAYVTGAEPLQFNRCRLPVCGNAFIDHAFERCSGSQEAELAALRHVVAAQHAVGDDRMRTAKRRRSPDDCNGMPHRRHRQLDPEWTQELTRSEAGGHKHSTRAD